MADFSVYFPKLIQFEGGFVDNPLDKGGPTKYGITLWDWQQYGRDINGDGVIDIKDLELITPTDAEPIAKTQFWNVLLADQINSQSVAEMSVDWAYTSGTYTVIERIQSLIGVAVDGKFGPNTLAGVNGYEPLRLFTMLKALRTRFYIDLVNTHHVNITFLSGWLNRVNSFKFTT